MDTFDKALAALASISDADERHAAIIAASDKLSG
jgi:hypothetical protein